MASIQCGNCKSTHTNVAEVRACYGQQAKASTPAEQDAFGGLASAFPAKALGPKGTSATPATEKQVAYAVALQEQRVDENDRLDRSNYEAMTKAEASKAIEWLLTQPKRTATSKAQAQSTSEPADGIYIVRGEGAFYSEAVIYKVYKMVHGSGRQGVKRLEIAEHGDAKFVYMGLATKHLPANAEKMGLEEAKTIGTLYGVCVRCGATLTDEESIAAGIGPVCAGKM